jgi:hypothetical protein
VGVVDEGATGSVFSPAEGGDACASRLIGPLTALTALTLGVETATGQGLALVYELAVSALAQGARSGCRPSPRSRHVAPGDPEQGDRPLPVSDHCTGEQVEHQHDATDGEHNREDGEPQRVPPVAAGPSLVSVHQWKLSAKTRAVAPTAAARRKPSRAIVSRTGPAWVLRKVWMLTHTAMRAQAPAHVRVTAEPGRLSAIAKPAAATTNGHPAKPARRANVGRISLGYIGGGASRLQSTLMVQRRGCQCGLSSNTLV